MLESRVRGRLGVWRVTENDVALLGGPCSLPTKVAVSCDISRGSPDFSSAGICHWCSATMSFVDAVLRWVPLGNARPTTVL